MIINRNSLLDAAPIKGMSQDKLVRHGVSFGMSEAGYDITLSQTIRFSRDLFGHSCVTRYAEDGQGNHTMVTKPGRFILASAVEEFDMPKNLIGVVHDKSTWARKGLSVFNTVIESGWKGHLTLELVYHGQEDLTIEAGSGIAQVLFHLTKHAASYKGKYQNQANEPVEAIWAGCGSPL
jgi:dCTP deaminase